MNPRNLYAVTQTFLNRDPTMAKSVAGIENTMTASDFAIQNAIKAVASGNAARIAEEEKNVIRGRIFMLDATTHMTAVYASAAIQDKQIPANVLAAAQKVLKQKQIIKKIFDERLAVKESAKLLEMLRAAKEAKWEMLDSARVVDRHYDPVVSFPAVPPSAEASPCDPTKNNTHAAPPGTGSARQRELLAYLASKGSELLAHMVRTRPQAPVTKNLIKWNRAVEPMDQMQVDTSGTHASFHAKSGCLVVDLDSFSSIPRMLTRVIHELTHGAIKPEMGHGPRFYSTFRFLLRVASEELGWTVEATCRETCFGFDEQGRPDRFCPKCLWQSPPEKCTVTAGRCETNEKYIAQMLADPKLSAKAKEFLSKTRPAPKK